MGTYAYYNEWRRALARLVGTTPEKIWNSPRARGPFAELINSSDCDGFFGPTTSLKLACDFKRFDGKAKAIGGDFWDMYVDWRKAFVLASGTGAVRLG